MPRYDGTGPQGAGPMTGGARGRCNPAGTGTYPLYGGGFGYGRGPGVGPGFGRGYGQRRGRGNRSGFGGLPPGRAAALSVDPSDEISMLKAQAAFIKSSLERINTRIEDLEQSASAES